MVETTRTNRKIVTQHVYPPIPDRRFDWSAVLDDYDGGFSDGSSDPVGRGATEQEAIRDLMEQIEEMED
jgi:hypothetical protein